MKFFYKKNMNFKFRYNLIQLIVLLFVNILFIFSLISNCDEVKDHIELGSIVEGNVTKECIIGKWEKIWNNDTIIHFEFDEKLLIIKLTSLNHHSYLESTWFIRNGILFKKLIKYGVGETASDAINEANNYNPNESDYDHRISGTTSFCSEKYLSEHVYKIISNEYWKRDELKGVNRNIDNINFESRINTNFHINKDQTLKRVIKYKYKKKNGFKYDKEIYNFRWYEENNSICIHYGCDGDDCEIECYIQLDDNYYGWDFSIYTRIGEE
jgi:hypothetical protein